MGRAQNIADFPPGLASRSLPGNSIESLATGTATFAAGATFAYEVDSTNVNSLLAAADLLVVSGDLNLDPGHGTLLTTTDLAGGLANFTGDYLADSNFVTITAVPEPSTLALAALGAALATLVARRRRAA